MLHHRVFIVCISLVWKVLMIHPHFCLTLEHIVSYVLCVSTEYNIYLLTNCIYSLPNVGVLGLCLWFINDWFACLDCLRFINDWFACLDCLRFINDWFACLEEFDCFISVSCYCHILPYILVWFT